MTRFPFLLLSLLLSAVAVGSASAQYLPEGAEQWYLRTDDGVEHYVVGVGDAEAVGDTVIVLHGGPGADHSYLFDAVLPLADRFHFVLYDQRGSLRSPAPDSTISYDRLVADLDALRADLGLNRLALLGHSNGAALAYAYLAAHPDRVSNLTLIGPVFPFWPGATPDLEMLQALGMPVEDPAWVEAYVPEMVARYDGDRENDERRAQEEMVEEGLDRPARNGREATAQFRIRFAASSLYHIDRWRQMRSGKVFYNAGIGDALIAGEGGWDNHRARWGRFYPALRAYAGPLTFVVGRQDFVDPGSEVWPDVVGLFDGADLVLFEEAGHDPWIDQPEQFQEAVRRALNRVSS